MLAQVTWLSGDSRDTETSRESHVIRYIVTRIRADRISEPHLRMHTGPEATAAETLYWMTGEWGTAKEYQGGHYYHCITTVQIHTRGIGLRQIPQRRIQ